MEPPTSFGLWLKERRKQLDLTQADLAKRIGCSVVTIRKIEADERRPSRQIAELLADCLEIAAAERVTFLKIARTELRVDRLAEVSAAEPAGSVLAGSPASLTSSLPTPPTPLVGREPELATIARLLQDGQCRLLTLVGPGGVGKTRLALEIAANQQLALANGVYFVSLAGVGAAKFVIPAIADGLGLTFAGPADPKTQLFNYLRDKQLLLIIDNFEHLLAAEEATADLPDMLQVAPRLKLLITSRERLHLQGEWIFEVQGLPLPPDEQVENVEAYSAVTLFTHSARRLQPDFNLTAETKPAVVRICRLLAGLPLGLELAAAWVRTLSCQEIAQEIERGLDFLAASTRDMPERHRSIKAVFDHSWKLLSAAEQRVLRQLSVFRGGFRREAAEAVAGATLPILAILLD
nr:helix-turn-helix domain-containing protein [Anaerolineae bacterium]